LILARDSHRNRLQALKARGRFKVRALLAAMQSRSAFGTFAFPIRIRRKRGRAIKTPRSHDALEQAGKAGAGNVQRRPWAGRPGPVGKPMVPGLAIGVLVAPLSILTVVVHVSNRLLELELLQQRPQLVCGASRPIPACLRINAEVCCGNRLKLEKTLFRLRLHTMYHESPSEATEI